MAHYKIETNRRGQLVARIHVSTKDVNTGKSKIITKRVYNEKNYTEARFEKYIDKLSLEFEYEIQEDYEEKRKEYRSRVLTFNEIGQEFVANIKKNLSINYYERAKMVVKQFNEYLEKVHLDKSPINEIKVRDVQVFLNSFDTYDSAPEGLVRLIKEFPKSVNLRLLEREKIIDRCSSYNLRKRNKQIALSKALQLCKFCNLDFSQYFEKIDTVKHYATETIKGYRRVLRTIFNEAIRYEWIIKNPVCQTKVGAGNGNTSLRPIHEKEVFSISQAQEFLRALDSIDDDYINKKVIIKFILLTGVRIGEMYGLKWSDIDFENHLVHIRRSRLYNAEFGNYVKSPKTKTSIRDIPLTDNLIQDLKRYYDWFKLADKDFENKLDEYYLAVNMYREPLGSCTVASWLRAIEQKYKFKHVSCHGLRHTYCSLLLSQNVPIQTVSKYMGHSDSTITLKVYSHFIPDTQEKVINALNNLI